jgi:hypothetical protein
LAWRFEPLEPNSGVMQVTTMAMLKIWDDEMNRLVNM